MEPTTRAAELDSRTVNSLDSLEVSADLPKHSVLVEAPAENLVFTLTVVVAVSGILIIVVVCYIIYLKNKRYMVQFTCLNKFGFISEAFF